MLILKKSCQSVNTYSHNSLYHFTRNINNYLPLQAYCTSCEFSPEEISEDCQSWFILFLFINHDSTIQFIVLYKSIKSQKLQQIMFKKTHLQAHYPFYNDPLAISSRCVLKFRLVCQSSNQAFINFSTKVKILTWSCHLTGGKNSEISWGEWGRPQVL